MALSTARLRHVLALPAFLLLLLWLPVMRSASAAELVMFDSASCSWCRLWDRDVGIAYPNTEEGQRAPLRRVDISRAARSGVRLARGVTSTPTFVLVEDGAEIGRITGYPGADFFWSQLGEMLARLAPPPPAIERERSAALRTAWQPLAPASGPGSR